MGFVATASRKADEAKNLERRNLLGREHDEANGMPVAAPRRAKSCSHCRMGRNYEDGGSMSLEHCSPPST